MSTRKKKIFAIASAGGHWQQLMQIGEAFEDHDTLFATTLAGLPEEFGVEKYVIVPDCNRHSKMSMLRCFFRMGLVMLRHRPNVVISTGALPGVVALGLGRIMGANTIWIDSVANAEEMSMSGRVAKHLARSWVSQWEHVAASSGATYAGEVL